MSLLPDGQLKALKILFVDTGQISSVGKERQNPAEQMEDSEEPEDKQWAKKKGPRCQTEYKDAKMAETTTMTTI